MIVIDASAAVDLLLDETDRWRWVSERVAAASSLHAPHLLDAEVANAIRGAFTRGLISRDRGRLALEDLADFRIERYAATPFRDRVWTLVDVLTAYDAQYVALAEALNCPLITTDERLARSHGHEAVVEAPV